MTDQRAAFLGNYANIVTRKTRSVAIVEIEIPIENMQAFIAAFGAPLPGVEIPVALARVMPEIPADAPAKPEEPAKERRRFNELPLSQQCAIRCGEPAFKQFLIENKKMHCEDDVAEFVRSLCEVGSRSQLFAGTPPGERWKWISADYDFWLNHS